MLATKSVLLFSAGRTSFSHVTIHKDQRTAARIWHGGGARSDHTPRRDWATHTRRERERWCQDVIIKWTEWKSAVSNVVKEISSSKLPAPPYLSDAPRTRRLLFKPHSSPASYGAAVSQCLSVYLCVCLFAHSPGPVCKICIALWVKDEISEWRAEGDLLVVLRRPGILIPLYANDGKMMRIWMFVTEFGRLLSFGIWGNWYVVNWSIIFDIFPYTAITKEKRSTFSENLKPYARDEQPVQKSAPHFTTVLSDCDSFI